MILYYFQMICEPPANMDLIKIASQLHVKREQNGSWHVDISQELKKQISTAHSHWFIHELVRALNVVNLVEIKSGRFHIVLDRVVFHYI